MNDRDSDVSTIPEAFGGAPPRWPWVLAILCVVAAGAAWFFSGDWQRDIVEGALRLSAYGFAAAAVVLAMLGALWRV